MGWDVVGAAKILARQALRKTRLINARFLLGWSRKVVLPLPDVLSLPPK
jgi:hypothetical protein